MANIGGFGFGGYNCDSEWVGGVEFPVGSFTQWAGSDIWVGGVKGNDTSVSVTLDAVPVLLDDADTWEFHCPPYPEGAIVERTVLDSLRIGRNCRTLYFCQEAISEQDLVTSSYDTVANAAFTGHNPFDGRPHSPLGLRLTQKSFAWSSPSLEDAIVIQYTLANIGYDTNRSDLADQRIRDVFVGVLNWGSVFYETLGDQLLREAVETLTGVLRTAPLPGYADLTDTLNVIWFADKDGDPIGDAFGRTSITSAFGVRLLAPISSKLRYSFNWWTAEWFSGTDWGPVRSNSRVTFPTSGIGAPLDDRSKYQMMSNGEWDYDQVQTSQNHEADGWLPAPFNAREIADGSLTFNLVSIGPFDLRLGESLTFSIAVVGGEDFHRHPLNFSEFFDPSDPEPYLSGLDFTDLALNAQWAAWVYDSPGFDTDGDGYRGDYYIVGEDTIYYRGDGVPDFKGPLPPNPPGMRLTSREGEVTIRFNGRRTETEQDAFSHRVDFEGYRLYMSRTGRREDYAMLTQRDLVNFARYFWNAKKEKWEFKDPPYTLDSLKKLYDSLSLIHYGHAFHPDSFSVALVEKALLVDVLDPNDPSILDTFYYYFGPYEANQTPNDRVLAQTVEAGIPVTGVIRKVYPDAKIEDTLYRVDGTPFLPYYEYEYVIDHLQLAEPVFFALTAFDHGDPISGLEPLESSVTLNAQEVWAINSAEVVKSTRPKPGVYPNPYKFSEYYNASGWENPRGLEPDPERARKVTFFNVPDTCVVSIWSIDGDLVRRIEHRENPSNSQASVVIWNLITRNTQAVKTGIYLYSIESRFGVDTGKLVIIK
jgi:hypothetical protein